MKLIDLLVKIANKEELPKKIKYKDKIWFYDKKDQDYKENNKNDSDLLGYLFCNCRTFDFINNEVEIIEDKPEKIEEIGIEDNMVYFDDKYQDVYYGHCDEFSRSVCIKLNEVIDKVNYLLEKRDKE